jgi:methylaspartate mutase epsilon subunit
MQGAAAAKTEQLDETSIAQECQLIEREVQAIFDSVIYCNPGNLADGVVTAFRKGLIDIPFAPSIYNKGEVVTVRDRTGAVRFLSPGNLQLAREEREFHRDKVQERLHAEGVLSEKQGYHLVERDVMQIARGQYTRWPLSS